MGGDPEEKEMWTDGVNEIWLSENDVVREIFGEFVEEWNDVPEGRTGREMGVKLWDDVYRTIIVLD